MSVPRPADLRTHLHHGLLSLSVLFSLLVLSACARERRGRVLVVGIDGASPRIVEALLRDGRLPNLQAIAERGVHGSLRSIRPLWSAPLWTTIATGKPRREHGITFFAVRREDGTLRLFRSSDRRVHALWNILSRQGLRVGVVNWWNTFPPEKVAGIVVSDAFFPEEIAGRRQLMKATGDDLELQRGLTVYPPSTLPRLRSAAALAPSELPAGDPLTSEALPPWVNRDTLRDVWHRDASVLELALTVEEDCDPDALLVYFPGIDRVSHWLWGAVDQTGELPPDLRFSPAQREAGRAALEGYYEQTDRWIGRILESYGSKDLVIVLSDHGMEAGEPLVPLTGAHESEKAQMAVLFAGGPGIDGEGGTGDTTVLDITPTVLAWLGLPVGEDMSGRVAPFLPVSRVRTVPTYDVGTIERLPATRSAAEKEQLEELRSLGYLD